MTESQLFVIIRQISITVTMTIIITINGYIINVNNIIIKYFVKIPSQEIIMDSAYSFVFNKSNITKLCWGQMTDLSTAVYFATWFGYLCTRTVNCCPVNNSIKLIFCLMALDFMIECHWVSVPVFHVSLLFSVIWPFCSPQWQMIWTLEWTLCTGSRCWMLWRGFSSPLTNHPPRPYKSIPYSCC